MKIYKKTKMANEILHKTVYSTVKFLLENNRKVSEREVARKYDFDRNLVGCIICKITIENALKELGDEKRLEIVEDMPITLFRSLLLLKRKNSIEIYEFFLCFGTTIKELNASNEKELKEILDLYLSNQIRTHKEYLKLKIKEDKSNVKMIIKYYEALVKKIEEEKVMLRKRNIELENLNETNNIMVQKKLNDL